MRRRRRGPTRGVHNPHALRNTVLSLTAVLVLVLCVVLLIRSSSRGGVPGAGNTPGYVAPTGHQPTTITPARIVVVGDGYAAGAGATDEHATSWAYLLAAKFSATPVVDGVGSSSYTSTQYPTLQSRVPHDVTSDAKLVILEAGHDDIHSPDAAVTAGVRAAIGGVRKIAPTVPIIVTAPIFPYPETYTAPTAAAMQAAVRGQRGVYLVDPEKENWLWDPGYHPTPFTTPDPKYVWSDKVHPNQAGHQRIADILAGDLARLRLTRPLAPVTTTPSPNG